MRIEIQPLTRQWLPTLLAVMCLSAVGIASAQAPSHDNGGFRRRVVRRQARIGAAL